MKRIILILLVVILLACGTSTWGTCPKDSFDRGKCDTMYVDPWDTDTLLQGNGPYFVRVLIYVTADVADDCDSIRAFVIPLRYTHTNPTRYCSVSAYWNNGVSFTNPRSIFRHLVADGDTLYNWMMDLYQAGNGEEWNFIALNLDGTSHFWLALVPTGSEDPGFGSGSRVLLATMTFKVQDTMQICIDTCFWPPNSHLSWAVADTFQQGYCGTYHTKIPRPEGDPNSFETCFNLRSSLNDPPNPFSLLSPPNKASFMRVVHFDWEDATDPDPGDQVKYDLYVSTSYQFPPGSTTIYGNLTTSEYTKAFDGGIYYWKVKAKDNHGAETWSKQIRYFTVTGIVVLLADFNADGFIDIGDVVFAINYLFRSGPAPEPLEVGDCNCDQLINIGDVVFLINYLLKGGPAPCEG